MGMIVVLMSQESRLATQELQQYQRRGLWPGRGGTPPWEQALLRDFSGRWPSTFFSNCPGQLRSAQPGQQPSKRHASTAGRQFAWLSLGVCCSMSCKLEVQWSHPMRSRHCPPVRSTMRCSRTPSWRPGPKTTSSASKLHASGH
jgi:hypothetical protein